MSDDFLRVYEEHVWRIYGYFAYRVRSSADAEDLTQVTFERAFAAWDRYDPERAEIATWLFTARGHGGAFEVLRGAVERRERG